MQKHEPRQPDLLAWPELRDAEAVVVEARRALALARRRYHYAPHGERKNRLSALQAASHAVLRAELALAQAARLT